MQALSLYSVLIYSQANKLIVMVYVYAQTDVFTSVTSVQIVQICRRDCR